jgi:O-methyltransferase involved in polyketide biosynthesis
MLASLRDISTIAAPKSIIVFDYLETDAFIAEKAAQRVQVLLMLAHGLGEPMQMGFNSSTIAEELAELGLQLHEDLNPSDIQNSYFQGRNGNYYACEHAHLVCVGIK